MDFIEGLPKSNGKEIIWVIVDRMSKYAHFISLSYPLSATTLAQVFLDQVYRLHGAPANTVSDKDPLFISHFWKEFPGQLEIEQNMSSSYHPQSDGQSEVVNRCLENYLRMFTWQQPQDWSKWLPMAEWWYNTSFHSAINTTPYEVVYGQAPPLHLPYLSHNSHIEAIDRSFTVRENMLRTLKDNLRMAVHKMKQQANKRRSGREFRVGEWAFVKLQAYRQSSVEKHKSEKLSLHFFGPYEVIAKVGLVAYTLKLTKGTRVHPYLS